jgi:hypothetical protein
MALFHSRRGHSQNGSEAYMNATNRRRLVSAVLAIISGMWGRADAGTVVWVADLTQAGTPQIGTLDLSNGQFTATGTASQSITALTTGSDGTLYAGTGFSDHIYTVAKDGALTQLGSATAPSFVFGLADAGSNGFFATAFANAQQGFVLVQFSTNGNSISTVGNLGLNPFVTFPTGALAFGPNGNLYYNSTTVSGFDQLYQVNPATGAATAVGSGLGLSNGNLLTLVAADGTLYGIGTAPNSGNGIYTIDTTTGIASFTGVSSASDILINAAAPMVPEPSTLTLLLTSTVALVGLGYQRSRAGRRRFRLARASLATDRARGTASRRPFDPDSPTPRSVSAR